MKTLLITAAILFGVSAAYAQNPKIVTARQANGVYRSYDNEMRILALGKNKLRVSFDGVYHTISKSVNTGYASGEAIIDGNVAVWELPEFGPCKQHHLPAKQQNQSDSGR